MSAERERYANRAALQCRPGVCVVSHLGLYASVCSISVPRWVCVCMYSYLSGFLWVDVCCVFCQVHVSVCEPFMVTDSIHLSRAFTVKRQLPVKKKKKKSSLDSFSSSPTAAAVDSSAQESPPWSSHPFQPANRTPEPTLRASREVLQDLEVCRTKHLLWQRTRFSQPTYRPEEAGGLQQRRANLHPEPWWLICLKINSSKKCCIAQGKLDLHNLKVCSLTSHHFQLLWFKYLCLVNNVSVCCVTEVKDPVSSDSSFISAAQECRGSHRSTSSLFRNSYQELFSQLSRGVRCQTTTIMFTFKGLHNISAHRDFYRFTLVFRSDCSSSGEFIRWQNMFHSD